MGELNQSEGSNIGTLEPLSELLTDLSPTSRVNNRLVGSKTTNKLPDEESTRCCDQTLLADYR